MKINIGTNKGNIVGIEIDKEWKDITMKDIKLLAKEKFGEIPKVIHGWVPHNSKAIIQPEDYKEKPYYKELDKTTKLIFDSYFSRAIAAGMEFEVTQWLETELEGGEKDIIVALQCALYEWDC